MSLCSAPATSRHVRSRLSVQRENRTPRYPPLSALEALADQLQQRGVKHIEGNIVGDDTAFPQEPYGTGWAWDDLVWDYGAPISALTVNDNIVYLAVMPGAQPGDPVTFTWNPDVTSSFYTVENDARTSVAGSQPSLGLSDGPLGSHKSRLFGTLPAKSEYSSMHSRCW